MNRRTNTQSSDTNKQTEQSTLKTKHKQLPSSSPQLTKAQKQTPSSIISLSKLVSYAKPNQKDNINLPTDSCNKTSAIKCDNQVHNAQSSANSTSSSPIQNSDLNKNSSAIINTSSTRPKHSTSNKQSIVYPCSSGNKNDNNPNQNNKSGFAGAIKSKVTTYSDCTNCSRNVSIDQVANYNHKFNSRLANTVQQNEHQQSQHYHSTVPTQNSTCTSRTNPVADDYCSSAHNSGCNSEDQQQHFKSSQQLSYATRRGAESNLSQDYSTDSGKKRNSLKEYKPAHCNNQTHNLTAAATRKDSVTFRSDGKHTNNMTPLSSSKLQVNQVYQQSNHSQLDLQHPSTQQQQSNHSYHKTSQQALPTIERIETGDKLHLQPVASNNIDSMLTERFERDNLASTSHEVSSLSVSSNLDDVLTSQILPNDYNSRSINNQNLYSQHQLDTSNFSTSAALNSAARKGDIIVSRRETTHLDAIAARELLVANCQARNNYTSHYNLMQSSSSKSSSPKSNSTPSPRMNAISTHQQTNHHIDNMVHIAPSNVQLDQLNQQYINVATANQQNHNQHQQYVNAHHNQANATTSISQSHLAPATINNDHQNIHYQQFPLQTHHHHGIQQAIPHHQQQALYQHLASNASSNVNHLYSSNSTGNLSYQNQVQNSNSNHQNNQLMGPPYHSHSLNSAAAAAAAAAVVSRTLKTVANQHATSYGHQANSNVNASSNNIMNMSTAHHNYHSQYSDHNSHSLNGIANYQNQSNHQLHTSNIVARKYHCKMCPQIFMSKAEMKYHNQNHMREAKPYKCLQCPKAFANSSYLSQHMRIHQGVKPYTCELCARKFTQLSHLQQHKRTHTGDKPYKCNYLNCTKQFSQLSNLQSHSRCHQLDKPYKCNSCYKCFNDEQSLFEHIPRHMESKHLKKNLCIFCGSSYQQERGLTKHFQQYHTEKSPALIAAALAAGTTGNTSLIASLVSSSNGTSSNSSSTSGSSRGTASQSLTLTANSY